jgi:hypothetical protein
MPLQVYCALRIQVYYALRIQVNNALRIQVNYALPIRGPYSEALLRKTCGEYGPSQCSRLLRRGHSAQRRDSRGQN